MKSYLLLPVMFLALLLGGCASLSETQIQSIMEFSEQYAELGLKPGNTVRSDIKAAYLDDRLTYNEHEKSTIDEARKESCGTECNSLDQLFNDVTEIRESQAGKREAAQQMDEIMKPIEIYISLLGSVATADYHKDIRQESQVLASSVQLALQKVPENIKTIKTTLNAEKPSTTAADVERAHKNMTEVSSYIGAMTYWAGKGYVRYQQTKALKKAVLGADQVFNDIVTDVIDMMDLFIGSSEGVGTLADFMKRNLIKKTINAEKKIKLKGTLDKKGLTEGSYTVGLESEMEDWFITVLSEGQETRKALVSLLNAHRKLAEALKEDPGSREGRNNFAGFIAFVREMNKELKEVRTYQKKLEEELGKTDSSQSN